MPRAQSLPVTAGEQENTLPRSQVEELVQWDGLRTVGTAEGGVKLKRPVELLRVGRVLGPHPGQGLRAEG